MWLSGIFGVELRAPTGSYCVNPRNLFKELVSYNRDFEGNDEQVRIKTSR